MGIMDDIAEDWHAALAALAWQVDLGALDALEDTPVDRYAQVVVPPATAEAAVIVQDVPAAAETPVAAAQRLATASRTLAELQANLAAFDHCEIKKGTRNTVFADGNSAARVLILGEAPGREEDIEGRPFVGAAGQLLDRMFASIGLSRTSPDPETSLYITNVLPWRPPGNRDPEPAEIAMMMPFIERHIELAAPEVIVVMGNTPCAALLNQRGILKLRGHWATALGRPVLPMTHPAYLLRTPLAKREAWADLLALRRHLNSHSRG
jgi:uracil-DNA glycosylase